MGPNQPQIGQSWYQSTPLYMYIQNIKLVFDWSEVCWFYRSWDRESLALSSIQRRVDSVFERMLRSV